jgi:hypothetical protein
MTQHKVFFFLNLKTYLHNTELEYPNSKIWKEVEGIIHIRSIYFIALQMTIAHSVFNLLFFQKGKLASYRHQAFCVSPFSAFEPVDRFS